MPNPKRSEIANWKLNVVKNQGSVPKAKVTFDMLFDKYSKQKAVTNDRPLKKDEVTHTSREVVIASQSICQDQERMISTRVTLYSSLDFRFALSNLRRQWSDVGVISAVFPSWTKETSFGQDLTACV
jgi:hypothetical protein